MTRTDIARLGFHDSQEFLASLVSLCPDSIIGVDRQGVVCMFNEAAERLTGWRAEDVLGSLSITEFYDQPESARAVKKALYRAERGGVGRLEEMDVVVRGRGGALLPVRLSAILLFHNGHEVGSVGFFHDVSERKQMEEDLRRLSITDSLTGLFNRRHFHLVLSEEVARCQRYRRQLSLVCLDLDNFKPFNDTFGHQVGDEILRLVAKVANAVLRQADTAFRLGGDEFALLLVETSLDQAEVAASRFRRQFAEEWRRTLANLPSTCGQVTMSLGLAQWQAGERSEGLLLRADLAMYEGKRQGGDRLVRAASTIEQRLPDSCPPGPERP
ncbi:MAG: sensor domain-containing diguanylate cyclase [Deltaproteobacteria bacterium]|nr:sensor domain-containing diguanylate cyclase [Deltaproteobacteria bacterium]